ncbi:MAG: tRNA (adenosine(37)-N6)-threonylcarbamoyltransferase complex ATPase subunit type 1 TsaE [Candidatus Levyibacteriota bacterium]
MVHSIHNSKSDKDTQVIGEEFAKELKPGDIVLLYGDLGFGKTTFVKGVAKGLGVTSRIISPTFVVIRSHKTHSGELSHIDLYRLENKEQLKEIGLDELMQDKFSIKLIEWPERMNMGGKRWEVKFKMNKDNTRTINIYEYK